MGLHVDSVAGAKTEQLRLSRTAPCRKDDCKFQTNLVFDGGVILAWYHVQKVVYLVFCVETIAPTLTLHMVIHTRGSHDSTMSFSFTEQQQCGKATHRRFHLQNAADLLQSLDLRGSTLGSRRLTPPTPTTAMRVAILCSVCCSAIIIRAVSSLECLHHSDLDISRSKTYSSSGLHKKDPGRTHAIRRTNQSTTRQYSSETPPAHVAVSLPGLGAYMYIHGGHVAAQPPVIESVPLESVLVGERVPRAVISYTPASSLAPLCAPLRSPETHFTRSDTT